MKITILDDYQKVVASLQCFQVLNAYDTTIIHEYIPNAAALGAKIRDTEILVLNRTRTHVTKALLDELPNLKLISQTGKLAGHIDTAACAHKGVLIAEGRGNPIATAELTWTLILNGLRNLPQAIDGMKLGKWQTNLGDRVHGKTIGIWGYGKIGKRIAQYANAFEANVLVWGSEKSRNLAVKDGFEKAKTKLDFFSNSDVISLHLRLNPNTRGIVKKEDLLSMKPNALFVNTARASLVEEGALIAALRAGSPARAALDVFEKEPLFDIKHEFLQMEQVICSPHMGYVERESYELYYSIAFDNCVQFINGNPTNIYEN